MFKNEVIDRYAEFKKCTGLHILSNIDEKNFICLYLIFFWGGGEVEKTLNPFNVNSDLQMKYYLKN